jgi:hypothetical protein
MLEEELPKLEEFFSIPAKNRRQQKYNYPALSRIFGLLPAPRLLFHGKCAYCETSLASQQGDVEHFRPKGRADDEQDKPMIVLSPTGANEKQRGYYWLAYERTNLIPCYQICNQPSTITDGRRIGKRGRFPIQGTRVAIDDVLSVISSMERPPGG